LTVALSLLTIAQVMLARAKSRAASSFLETAAAGVRLPTIGEAAARDARREVMMINFISRLGVRMCESNVVKSWGSLTRMRRSLRVERVPSMLL
jgi:hypothetical protein